MTQTATGSLVERLASVPSKETFNERVGELVAPILADRDQLVSLRVDLKAQYKEALAEVEQRIVVADRVLRAAGYAPEPVKKPKKGGAPKPSSESIEKLVRWLAGQEEPQSINEMHEKLGISLSSVSKQVSVARQIDLIRVAKMGGSTGRMQFFSAFDNSVGRLDAGDVRWP